MTLDDFYCPVDACLAVMANCEPSFFTLVHPSEVVILLEAAFSGTHFVQFGSRSGSWHEIRCGLVEDSESFGPPWQEFGPQKGVLTPTSSSPWLILQDDSMVRFRAARSPFQMSCRLYICILGGFGYTFLGEGRRLPINIKRHQRIKNDVIHKTAIRIGHLCVQVSDSNSM